MAADVRPLRRRSRHDAVIASEPDNTLEAVVRRVAHGDESAFERLYDDVSGAVFGLIRRVLRDPAQAEEVTQEVFVEVWRTATRFDARKGSARTWILTMAHRRAVDRVRSAQATHDREDTVAAREQVRVFDEVAEEVELRLEQQQVHHCLGTLTELQRESVTLAFYGGYTYPEVATLLGAPLGTVKTRMRDGLIRLRDCLGVTR
ncbi:MAG: polymerase subunit sigma [Blastococcus sp.]|nr:polymerase subunit sigma [Blastococcus sp.]